MKSILLFCLIVCCACNHQKSGSQRDNPENSPQLTDGSTTGDEPCSQELRDELQATEQVLADQTKHPRDLAQGLVMATGRLKRECP